MAHPCTLSDCSCVKCNCSQYVCPKPCSTLARIQRRVRMPMTLWTSRKSAFNISGFDSNSRATGQNPHASDPFSGPSDRASRSLNTITGKRGVDKKHNSYARYLGRRKAPILRADMEYGAAVGGCGNTICCHQCECQQLLRVDDTGNFALQTAQVGDIVTQKVEQGSYTASGVIIAIERNTGLVGDLDRILVKVDDCATKPFISSLDAPPGSPDTHIIQINGLDLPHHVTVITTDTCGKGR